MIHFKNLKWLKTLFYDCIPAFAGTTKNEALENEKVHLLSGRPRLRSRIQSSIKILPGFSFIEMMIALTLLSTFGTSLFLVQSSIFSKLSKTHQALTNMFELDKQLLKFNQEVQFAVQQKKSIDTVTVHHENKNPDYTVNIKLKQIDQNSKLFKDFGQHVRIVQASITQDKNSDLWWSFVYAPPAQNKDEITSALPTAKESA